MWDKLRFAIGVIASYMLKKNVPLCVGIHITSRCNFRCIYCYGGYAEKHANDFDASVLLELVNELKSMGTLWITLTGGEPLLRQDIGEIVDKIKKERIICAINTNGSLIKSKIDIVKKIDFVTVSLDGLEAANDSNRGEGTFKLIMDGINCLKANMVPFDVVCVLTRHNINNAEALLDLAEKLNFYVVFNVLQDQNVVSQDQSVFSIDDKDLRHVIRKIIGLKKRGKPISYTVKSHRYILDWPLSFREKIAFRDHPNFKPYRCFMGSRMCHIDYDGKVYPCNQLAGRFSALNFLESGFKKAWENLKDRKNCKACYAVCFTEFNRLFGLSSDVWINNAKQLLKNKINH
jgi:AdoMet-dependent heme synthase